MGAPAAEAPATVPADVSNLFAQIEKNFEQTSLGPHRWYIATTAVLVGGTNPDLCADLYTYLIEKPEYSTPTQRQELVRRIREALFKAISIVGVCKPIEAIMAINQRERDEDKDHSTTREGWQCDEKNLERGMDWIHKLYQHNADAMLNLFKDHQDFAWVTKHITSGLYVSDRQVLDDVETEMVVFPGIMIQNLPKETHWHMRAVRRLGVTMDEVRLVWESVQLIAGHLGLKLDRVPTVEVVEPDV